MVHKMSRLVSRVSKGSFRLVLAGYIVMVVALGQFIQSSITVFSIVFPIAIGMCEEMEWSPSKMMFPLGICCIAGISILPIGSGLINFARWNGLLETYGYTTYQVGIMDVTIARLPLIIILALFSIFILPRFCPDKPVLETKIVEGRTAKAREALPKFQEVMGYAIFLCVLIGFLFSSKLGIQNWQISLAGAVLTVACKILKPKEAYEAMSLNGMAVTYVGVLAMGTALTATGAGQLIGDTIASMLGNAHNGYLIGFAFFITPFLLTQFMNNVAVMNIFYPIAILTCKSLSCNPIGPMLLVSIGAATAFMTPLATPTVPVMMGLGGYDQKTMLKMSVLPSILLCVVSVLWVMSIFPAY